jgi:hypothetical protein
MSKRPSCFICYSKGEGSMNFVKFSDDKSIVKLMSASEVTKAIQNDEDIQEVRLCDLCLHDLRHGVSI